MTPIPTRTHLGDGPEPWIGEIASETRSTHILMAESGATGNATAFYRARLIRPSIPGVDDSP